MLIKQKAFWIGLSSVLMLYLSWPPMPFAPLLFVALVPLFIVYSQLTFRYWILTVFIALFGWNTLSTYWIYYTLPVGAFFIHLINSIIFTIPFIVFSYTQKRIHKVMAFLNFGLVWISLEYMHLTWELAFPFLNLGNGLAMYPSLFQWYEYIGSLGGSIWILLINILVAELIIHRIEIKNFPINVATLTAIVILMPLLFSFFKFKTYKEVGSTVSVVAVNPAIDCYNEKYVKDMSWVIQKNLAESDGKLSDFILWPETAIPDAGLSDQLNTNPYLETIKDKLAPNTILVTGAIIYKRYGKNVDDKVNKTFYPALDEYLSVHNAAIEIQKNSLIRVVRTKKNLVPFEESAPYPDLLAFVKNSLGSLGGFSFSYLNEGMGYSETKGVKATPLICYEVLFGEEVAMLSFRSNIFFLLLNEGWYRNETGSLQFLYYSSLRAVETRRAIARSSNMGISAMIDQKGTIINRSQKIDKPSVLKGVLHLNDSNTFYASFGDFLGYCTVGSLIIINSFLCFYMFFFIEGKFNWKIQDCQHVANNAENKKSIRILERR